MVGFIKNMSIGLLSFSRSLTSIVNSSEYTKCIFLNNQQCITQPITINLDCNKYIWGLP